jgi:predicted Zn-dependent protease
MTTFYYNDDLLNKEFKRVFRRACAVWCAGLPDKLNMQYVDRMFDPSDMSIIVKTNATLRANECGRAVLAANIRENNYLLLNSNMKFGTIIDTDFFGNTRRLFSKDFDLLSTCEHELGHILGLKHSESYNSIMQDTYQELPKSPSSEDFVKVTAALQL